MSGVLFALLAGIYIFLILPADVEGTTGNKFWKYIRNLIKGKRNES